MKLTYWIRNKKTKEIHSHVELVIQDEVVIEALKDQMAAPMNCDMENMFEYHDIYIDND